MLFVIMTTDERPTFDHFWAGVVSLRLRVQTKNHLPPTLLLDKKASFNLNV